MTEINIEDLERRISEIEQNLKNMAGALIGSYTVQAKVKQTESKKADKATRQAELLKGVPYVKADLDAFKATDKRWLAGALGISTFQMKMDEIVKKIMAEQKKKKEPAKK